MKKVGIMSMQRIKNYGSFLQAYALKYILKEMDCNVEFVDYHVGEALIKDYSNKNSLSKIFDILKEDAPLIQKIQYILHKKNFSKKYFDLLGLTKEPNYNPKLDTLVIGSDEVFNCIQSNKNVGYSLELFGQNNNADKLISYAASFGNTTLEKIEKFNKKDEISNCLKEFDSISVRDENSFNIVDKLTGKEIVKNLDPVLVFDYMNRNEIPNIKIKEKYMIVYAYSGRISKKESDLIKSYAKRNHLKIYAIGGAQRCADRFVDCSPFEVLAYFKNAECIVTDTFHGSIFSIINNKPFLTIVRKSNGDSYGNEEKLSYLLKKLELDKRIIENCSQLNEKMFESIDYSRVNQIILEEKMNTKNYLKNNV